MVTKVYNVADLLATPRLLEDSSDDEKDSAQKTFGSVDGGFGGGGMFQIPDNIHAQLGGGMGGGMGGMGGGMGAPLGTAAMSAPESITVDLLVDLVREHLHDDQTSWMNIDGAGGVISAAESMLIVTHRAAVHKRVEAFLQMLRSGQQTSPTVQIDLRIIEVTSEQAAKLDSEPVANLASLADGSSAARLSLRCNNHRVASVSSGLRRSYVISVTPVVGGNPGVSKPASAGSSNIGYQPVTIAPLLGLFGKVKPEINEDGKRGTLHLGIELASGPEEILSTTVGSGQTIDRLEIASARLETSVPADVDTWTPAGTVAMTDPTSGITSGAALPHLIVLARWQVAD
jgi:hypothetical protein